MSGDEFYIGYATPVPAGSRVRVFGGIAAALVAAIGIAIALVWTQAPFADSSFAFGRHTRHAGVIRLDPHPILDTADARVPLVAPGKHGADALVAAFVGQAVTLDGAAITRGTRRMLELRPGSIVLAGPAPASGLITTTDLGTRTLSGEIVDGKCYLGVMNPGEGTVHRDCAGVCLRGGIPPLFVAHTRDGRTVVLGLTGADGEPVGVRYASLAGRPVVVTGAVHIEQPGEQWTIRASRVELAGVLR